MATKSFVVGGRPVEIAGISEADPYFNGISREFEEKFQAFCRSFLDQDSVAMDIGANIGATSIILSHYLPQGSIFALEPGKMIFQLLKGNLERNAIPNVAAYNYAIADKTKTLRFIERSAYGHIDANGLVDEQDEHAVTAYALDDLVTELGLDRLDFIKVDVEGFEPQFFEGAKQTLARFNPIIYFELNSWCLLDHAGNNPIEFMKRICGDFRYVYRISKDPDSVAVLEEVRSEALAQTLVHENIVHHGSVDDIVVCNDPAKLHRSALHLAPLCDSLRREMDQLKVENEGLFDQFTSVVAERDGFHDRLVSALAETNGVRAAFQAERTALRHQLDLMLRSRSWRYTRFLRR